jgi:hypothetical protein
MAVFAKPDGDEFFRKEREMKIKAAIIEVSDLGDHLAVKAQGREAGAAGWMPSRVLQLEIPATAQMYKAYHLNRKIVVEIKPEKE